jgi:hypothetical protein
MNGIDSNNLLQNLESITKANLDFVENQVQNLSQEQLNWKQHQESWNVLQVLAHLNAYAKYYQRIIKEKIQYTRHNQPVETFTSSPLGKSAWMSVKLGNLKNMKRRLRAPRNYNPSVNKSLLVGSEIEDFIVFQQQLLELLNAAKSVNLRKVRIPIALSKFIKLRLGDAFLFHVYHNERHVEQINKIIQNQRFPR